MSVSEGEIEASYQENQQREIIRLMIKAGQLLLSHGAESALVVDITRRIGVACGVDEIEISLNANSLIITTNMYDENHCQTTVRQSPDKGINMQMVTEIQRVCILLERQKIDFNVAKEKIEQLIPTRYNRWLIVIMIGLSCGAFSHLSGGDATIFLVTFVASSIGMIVRQEFASRHFNPLLNFAITAFVTTLVSIQAVVYSLGNHPFLAMASSVLMLVPGFPLINAVADSIKGYVNIGISRFVMASLLTLAICLGIVAAMTVTNVWGWI